MADLKHIFLGLHARPQPGGPHPMPGQPPASPVPREDVHPPHRRPGQIPPPRKFAGYGGHVFDSQPASMEGGS